MAEGSSGGQEKTEEPTARKLEKASEDGQILSSKEMFVFSSLLVGLFGINFGFGYLRPYVGAWAGFFRFDSIDNLNDQLLARLSDAFSFILVLSAIIAVVLFVVIVGTQAAIGGGLNFSTKAMGFKASKMNPISGFKRMFSVKGLVELGKGILKVGLLGAVGGGLIYSEMPHLIEIPAGSLGTGLEVMRSAMMLVVGGLLIVLLLIGALDLIWQHHTLTQKLKMTLQEVKDENKNTEGNPEIKAKIRRMQIQASRRAAKQLAALDDVPRATAVIVNPTHFAVALEYRVGDRSAPKVLAMGRGLIAEQIIARANEHAVTVYRSPILARALYFTSDIGQEISEALYGAVAAVLAYIYRVENGEVLDEPVVELPEDMRFDEFGRPMGAG